MNVLGENGHSVKNLSVFPKWKLVANLKFKPDPKVNSVIQKYVEKIDPESMKTIAVLGSSLDSRSNFVRSVETSMSNLLGDACLEYFKSSDLAVVSGGGIRYKNFFFYSRVFFFYSQNFLEVIDYTLLVINYRSMILKMNSPSKTR